MYLLSLVNNELEKVWKKMSHRPNLGTIPTAEQTEQENTETSQSA